MSERSDRANAAMRAICEGTPPTVALMAAVSGRTERGILRQASLEGWRLADTGEVRLERGHVRRVVDRAVRLIETIRMPDDPAALKGEKERIELVASITRTAEKIEDLIGRLNENDKDERDDEDIADVFRRIDRRIEELARDYARKLVAERDDGQSGQERWQRLVRQRPD